MCAKPLQSCPTLCDPMDCSPPGSSVHGILQARILGWVAFPFSRGSSQPRDRTQVSHIAGRFFTSWATREALLLGKGCIIYFTMYLIFRFLLSLLKLWWNTCKIYHPNFLKSIVQWREVHSPSCATVTTIYFQKSIHIAKLKFWDFLDDPVVKNPPTNAGDTGSIPVLGRFHMLRDNEAQAPQLLSLWRTATEVHSP